MFTLPTKQPMVKRRRLVLLKAKRRIARAVAKASEIIPVKVFVMLILFYSVGGFSMQTESSSGPIFRMTS